MDSDENSLSIVNVNRTAAGVYMCKADNQSSNVTLNVECESVMHVYMLRPDSQPLTRFEVGRPASKQVSVSSFKAGQI